MPDAFTESSDESLLPEPLRRAIEDQLESFRSEYREVGLERLRAERYMDRGILQEVWVELYEFVPQEPSGAADPG